MIADIAAACDVVYFAERQLGITLDAWQADLLRAAAQPRARVAVIASRQSGKSMCSCVLVLHEVIYRPGSTAVVLAPTERQAAENLREIVRMYGQLDRGKPKRLTETTLETVDGSRVLSLPGGNVAGIRGFRVSLAVIDEAAYCEDDLYVAAAPMLAVSGGRMLLASTPNGASGFFYESCHSPAWNVSRITAHDIPRITPEFLAEQERTMQHGRFMAEYMCCFNGTEDSVFQTEDIEALLTDADPLVLE